MPVCINSNSGCLGNLRPAIILLLMILYPSACAVQKSLSSSAPARSGQNQHRREFEVRSTSGARFITYYVSPSGSDSNPGTQTAPFRQIRAALAVIKPGDTVYVEDGDYLGFDIDGIHAEATALITIEALGAKANVTPTTDRSNNRDTIFVTHSSYIVLDGLNAFNANRGAVRIDHSSHITVRNGVYGNNTTWGIFTDFSDDLLIEDNECFGSKKQHGIYVSNSCVNPTVNHNRCHDNYQCGIHMNGDASEPGTGLIIGATIENNIIYNNGAGGGGGINLDGVQNSIVVNNLLYNNHANGIAAFKGDGAAGPKSDNFYFNTIDMAANSRQGLVVRASAGTNRVRNNILYNRNPAHGGLLFGDDTDIKNTDSDNNILDRVSLDESDTLLTLAQWQAQRHEPHSRSAIPSSVWVNPSNGDYHLLSTAPAIGAGLALASVAIDLDSNPRLGTGASDMGCFKFVRNPGEIAFSLSASPNVVVGGAAIKAKIRLNSSVPEDGAFMSLKSSSSVASVPGNIKFAPGATIGLFTISTRRVTANTTVTLYASYKGTTKMTTLLVLTTTQ